MGTCPCTFNGLFRERMCRTFVVRFFFKSYKIALSCTRGSAGVNDEIFAAGDEPVYLCINFLTLKRVTPFQIRTRADRIFFKTVANEIFTGTCAFAFVFNRNNSL